jgi:endonuclease/exonuclease/phosphatase (EEP) superfamily protein YafD
MKVTGQESIPPASRAMPGLAQKFRTRLGALLALCTWLYTGGLLILLLALEWWGERNWLLSLAIFAPPQILLAPVVLLGPLAILIRPRLLWWQLGCVALVACGYMTFRWHTRPVPNAKTLTLVTHNIGEGNRQQFFAFLDTVQPSVIALQDARYRGVEYAQRYPEFYVAHSGEFCLLSRHLIQQSKILDEPKWHGRPVAARYEIICDGQPLVIYNVHMPTPRGQFNHVLSRRFVRDIFAEDDAAPSAGSYREWIEARIELARGLARVLAAEQKPFLAVGDFNMPDHGYIYHLFAGEMTDSFAHAGRGWGLTFPGETRNPAAFFGPWLRLDFAFAGRGWKPVFCVPEPGRKSQHCAVMADFIPAAR